MTRRLRIFYSLNCPVYWNKAKLTRLVFLFSSFSFPPWVQVFRFYTENREIAYLYSINLQQSEMNVNCTLIKAPSRKS